MTTNELIGYIVALLGVIGNVAQYYLNNKASYRDDFIAAKDSWKELYETTRQELDDLKEHVHLKQEHTENTKQ